MKFALKRLRTAIGSALCAACLLGLAPAFGQDSAIDASSPDADTARRVTILYLGTTDKDARTEARLNDLVEFLRRIDDDSNVKATRQIYSPYEISVIEGETVGEATCKNLLDALTALEKIPGDDLELRLLLVIPIERKYREKGNGENNIYDWYLYPQSENVKWNAVDSVIISGRDGSEPDFDLSNFQRVFAVVDLLTNEPTTRFLPELAQPPLADEGSALGYVCLDSLAPANYLTLVRNCLEARSARLKASLKNGDLSLFEAVRYIAKYGTAASATTLKSAVSDDAKIVLLGEDYPLVRGARRLDTNAPTPRAVPTVNMPRPPFNL